MLHIVCLVVLDEAGEFTEAEWEAILKEQGQALQNVAGTVDSIHKKREQSKLNAAFTQVNASQALASSPGLAAFHAELDRKSLAANAKHRPAGLTADAVAHAAWRQGKDI